VGTGAGWPAGRLPLPVAASRSPEARAGLGLPEGAGCPVSALPVSALARCRPVVQQRQALIPRCAMLLKLSFGGYVGLLDFQDFLIQQLGVSVVLANPR